MVNENACSAQMEIDDTQRTIQTNQGFMTNHLNYACTYNCALYEMNARYKVSSIVIPRDSSHHVCYSLCTFLKL